MDRLWAMEVFVSIVEAGSFSHAAQHLGIANSSITSCIRNLESHLSVTLLQRTTRHVHLTEEGTAFYRSCCDILAQVEEVKSSLSRKQPSGTLRVELPIALGHMILGPALVKFTEAHPELKVIVGLTNDVDILIRRGIDIHCASTKEHSKTETSSRGGSTRQTTFFAPHLPF